MRRNSRSRVCEIKEVTQHKLAACPSCSKIIDQLSSTKECTYCGVELRWPKDSAKVIRCIDPYRGLYTGDIVVHFKRELMSEEDLKEEPNLYMYEILGEVMSADNLEEMVIYRALYEGNAIYARKKCEFLDSVDKIKYPEIKQIHRFEKMVRCMASVNQVRVHHAELSTADLSELAQMQRACNKAGDGKRGEGGILCQIIGKSKN